MDSNFSIYYVINFCCFVEYFMYLSFTGVELSFMQILIGSTFAGSDFPSFIRNTGYFLIMFLSFSFLENLVNFRLLHLSYF